MSRIHNVSQETTAGLERARRELTANLGLLAPNSPAHVPVRAQIQAIDIELLAREYEKEWKVWRPGRYVADHRYLDISLVSDSFEGLVERLRDFTGLIKDLS